MQRLTVLYDDRCNFCTAARGWLERQPSYVELEFLPVHAAATAARFPELDPAAFREELTVVGDDGAVYRGYKAWVVSLWATHKYREWAMTLSSPELMPSARRFVQWVSRNRRKLAAAGRML